LAAGQNCQPIADLAERTRPEVSINNQRGVGKNANLELGIAA
jgi:hypothetical protein